MTMSLQARLLASTFAIGTALAALPVTALAQSTQEDQASRLPTAGQLPPSESGQVGAPAADGTDIGDVVVTGSRIASAGLTSASPLQVVDAQAIRSTGAANLQDVLLQNPVFGTPFISRTNSNFSTSGAGLATVDLRNLGTARTLVLVNGRRFVSGNPNEQAVDLNSIPTAFIDRTEILTGGASSIYGSDAVAGVVNIVYKTNFQGIEANVQAGISEEGDDARKQMNLTIGGNFDEGRGNVIAYVGYSRDGTVFSRDRARSAVDQTDTAAGVTGDIADLFTFTAPFLSSFAPQGRYFGAGGATVGTFNSAGQFIPGFSINGSPTRAADGYNRSAFRTIALPVERFLIATRATYEVAPAVNVFLEGTFAKSRAETELEPFAISTSGTNGIFQGTGGFFPVEQRLANGTLFVNPFVPAALLARLTDTDGDGLRDVSFTRRLSDIANRGSIADRTTFRVTTGVNGNISTKFKYDAFVTYGRTDDNQTSTGQVNLANFRSALVVTQNATGNLVCADVNARAQGCVPANVFGANTLSPAAANYVRADGNRTAYADQLDTGANISGELFDPIGAGPIGAAVGFEYRRESSSAKFDALQQAGLNGGNAIPNTSGNFDVTEGYGEIRVPILHDSFIKDLTLVGAGRVSKYSTIGTVYSWNYGGEFAPFPGLRFRAVRARATRAPNVSELFQGASQTFPTGLIDPCVGVTATSTGTASTVCRSFPGVNANIAANPIVTGQGSGFVQTQADLQGVSGFDTGNPNLNAERGDTLTVGAVINPRELGFLRNLSLTVDYSRTRISDAIVSTPRQFILQQCFAQGNQQFCQFVTRRPTIEGANSPGSLQFVNSGQSNSGGVFNSAIDVTANYLQDLSGLGIDAKLSLGGAYTHVFKFYQIPLPGADKDNLNGEIGAASDRFLATAGIDIGGVRFQYRGTYIGRSYVDDQFVRQLSDGVDANGDPRPVTNARDPRARIGAKFYSDLQMQVLAGEHVEFYVGANNLLNTSPPPIYSNVPGSTTGAETDSGTYDAIGRRFYAGARLRF
jgi:outer membrane receptor protein involved in Fe transport